MKDANLASYSPPAGDGFPAYLGTAPVPAGPYYQDDYFELEREAIFKRSWLHIGHVCELPEPGSFMVREIEIAEASILVTRDSDGIIRAFHNVCPHRGTQLVTDPSEGKRSSFTCPYHAWTFNADGALRSATVSQLFPHWQSGTTFLAYGNADRRTQIPWRVPYLLGWRRQQRERALWP